MPRIAVIGAGSIGKRHLANLQSLGCEAVAFDLVPGGHVRPCWDLDAFHPDAVVIATPWDAHLAWVEWAVDAGIPFLVEKPLGSLDQLPRWRELAAMYLPVNQVGYQFRFHHRYRAMRQVVPRPTHGEFRCECHMASWPGGAYGPALLEASHEMDLALDCGLDADHVYTNTAAPRYYRSWRIVDGVSDVASAFCSAEQVGTDMYRAEMAHFLECVREQKPTDVPLVDGLRVLETVAKMEAE
jgi:predicted dehydrogenase